MQKTESYDFKSDFILTLTFFIIIYTLNIIQSGAVELHCFLLKRKVVHFLIINN